MSRDCCAALPHDVQGLSAVCDCGIPDHNHLLFLQRNFEHLTFKHILFQKDICTIINHLLIQSIAPDLFKKQSSQIQLFLSTP